jgi:ribokinase
VGGTVVVVGSVNVDLVLEVDRRPDGGETVLAAGARRRPGGKGANQAAAAARAGADVRLVAAVGDDADAVGQLDALRRDGVDTAHVRRASGSVTGLALITVTPDGENAIVVVPGANHRLTAEDAVRSLDGLATGTVVVLQTEVLPDVVDAAAAVVAARRCRLVLSDGPVAPLAAATLAAADPVVVNRSEARQLAEHDLDGEDLADAVLAASGARSVVVTLGAEGAVVAGAHGSVAVPGVRVPRVVDTTGAGDVLVGALAARLAGGLDLPAATAGAVAAAAQCVGWPGARPEPD